MTEFVTGGPPRFAHQRLGLRKLIATGGVTALLFDPGTGKTAVAIDYACLLALKLHGAQARVLVACPVAVADTWVLQMPRFASPQVQWWAGVPGGSIRRRVETLAWLGGQPFKGQRPGPLDASDSSDQRRRGRAWPQDLAGPRVTLAVIGIEALSSRMAVGSKTMADLLLEGIRRFSPDLLIVDESHRIKGPSANASRLLGRASDHVRRRMILTGTVMPHDPLDVFAQWRFLQPYAFGPITGAGQGKATYTGFRGRYAVMGGYMGKEVKGFVNLDEMQAIMARNAVVARKEDVLDLPPVTDSIVPVRLSLAEQRAYDEMKQDFETRIDSGELVQADGFLAQLMKLRQVTSGLLPDDNGQMHRIGDSKARTVAEIVNTTLEGEKRVVVFALFVAEIHHLAQVLARKGTRVEVITGETAMAERMRIRQDFGSDGEERIVLVAQVRTMSLGVNELVTASHAVFASQSQLRDDFVQARDRLNRTGQKRPVTFWYALGVNQRGGATIDGVILGSHEQRSDLEAAVLAHVRDHGGGS